MKHFLWKVGVLFKDFKAYSLRVTEQIREAVTQVAVTAGRPVEYLASSAQNKEEHVREIIARDGLREGLVCVLRCVEPCWSYEIQKDRATRKLRLRGGLRRCLHYYNYFLDPDLGLIHARLQSWFPFTMHVCLNGREWLARQMDAAGIGYVRRDNCFVQIDDLEGAQALMNRQLQTDWPGLMQKLAARVNPAHGEVFRKCPVDYYWSADESEWASDVMFRSQQILDRLYPSLIRHGIETLSCRDVLRFLGRKVPASCRGEVVTDLKVRPEGVRLKHRLNQNSIKMYNKQGSVLRLETTINDARDLKVYRTKEGDESGPQSWRPLRKGVADMHRRAQFSQAANERYAGSLAEVTASTPVGILADEVCRPVVWQGRRSRALNPLAPDDAKLLQAVAHGEFVLSGFRNRDLRPLLYGSTPATPADLRRQSGAITRKLRLLRAHGLIKKVQKTHRYELTEQGRTTILTLLAVRHADASKLTNAA
jgi:hypothetical protein